MKKCPYCAEEIQDDAIKCKHCGEMLANKEGETPILMKRFESISMKDGKKCGGTFEAVSEKEAREKLIAQGYDIISLKEVTSLDNIELSDKEKAKKNIFIPIAITLTVVLVGSVLYWLYVRTTPEYQVRQAVKVIGEFTKELGEKTEDARINAARADIKANIATALKLYELDNGRFPTTEEGLMALRIKLSSANNWNGPYLVTMPVDPWNNSYKYTCPGVYSKNGYDLSSDGPDGIKSRDDITNRD